MTITRLLQLVVCGALVSGCAGWYRIEVPTDTVLARRQQVQIWQGSRSQVLHAVRVRADTVSGIPFFQPLSCDSCLVTIPRAGVDSLRLGNQEGPAIAGIMLPLVGGLLFMYLVSQGLRD